MDRMPDAWPPSVDEQTAPLFPLPNVWLFPGVLMPLHIFEPRYREMIEDSMDGPGRIVMGTIVAGHEEQADAAPPVHGVAGVGEIVRHERLPDGRFAIQLLGIERVALREVSSDKPYRRVAYEPLVESHVDADDAAELAPALRDAIADRVRNAPEIPEDLPIGTLADVLLMSLDLPHENRQALYAESDPGRRARGALEAHAAGADEA